MAKLAAGILLYRRGPEGLEVLLVHPGGPLWVRKDDAAWSVPKGEPEAGEDPLAAAEREFSEEVGSPAPPGRRLDLGEVRQASGKRVRVWAVEGDLDASACTSNHVELEWPPGSGRVELVPEVDRAEWFALGRARRKLVLAQAAFVERLAEQLGIAPPAPAPDPAEGGQGATATSR